MTALNPSYAPLEVSERQFQQAVIQLARHLGWSVWHHHDSRRQAGGRLVGDLDAKGWPDLALAREKLLLRELKAEKGRLSWWQQQTFDTLKAAGADVDVWRPSMWSEIERVLRG